MRLLVILGNGFSIDLIKRLKKEDKIDLRNLFRLGHTIKFPDGSRPGFLSFRYCPALWSLGARPNKDISESNLIIEEIITCSNMLSDYIGHPNNTKRRTRLTDGTKKPIHMMAYCEFVAYIKNLFIEYNEQVDDQELLEFVQKEEWGWLKFLKKTNSDKYEKITVVTYNYDIWLERILDILKIEYSIVGISEKKNAKLDIIKPHGSISFCAHETLQPFKISYNLDQLSTETKIEDLRISYVEMGKHSKSFLIPPAGDSSRWATKGWAVTLREKAESAAQLLSQGDEVVICGMSYWHVDRKELDALLINLDHDINISFVNPSPPKDLNAVLMTLFANYASYLNADILGDLIYD